MSFRMRPYQIAAVDAIESAYQRGRRSVLVVMPTGTGKTVCFCSLVQRRVERGDYRPTLILAHREELLQQAADKFGQIAPDLPVGIEHGSSRAPASCAVVIASVQTLGRQGSKRQEALKPGLIIVDECHHAAARGYGICLERYAGSETQILGVTATPKRLDRQALHGKDGAVFEEVAYSYNIKQAIADGWLADIRGYRVQTETDLSGVKTTAGDFNAGELARRVDAPERTEAALKHWREVAKDRRTIAFCASVEHAYHVAEAFRAAGVRAEAADGGMERGSRAQVVERFRSGELQVLANCELYTEGFDVPEASCALMLRPTQSWSLFVQMVGRVTRIAPGKSDCVVLDVIDNCQRHSLATVPAILDLPPSLDLQGQSLAKAAKALDEMGERAAVLQHALPGNWAEIQTIMEQVDLFANVEPAPELVTGRLAWLSVPGGYRLSFDQGRQANLTEDALGCWTVTLTAWDGIHRCRARVAQHRCGDDRLIAVRRAEQVVLHWWPEVERLSLKAAPWRGQPPTEKQLALLRRLGQPESVLSALTKGTAGGLIDQLLAQRPDRRYSRV